MRPEWYHIGPDFKVRRTASPREMGWLGGECNVWPDWSGERVDNEWTMRGRMEGYLRSVSVYWGEKLDA